MQDTTYAGQQTYVGPISMTAKGMGFFKFPLEDDEAAQKNPTAAPREDLFIPAKDVMCAFPGDIVRVVSVGMIEDPRTRAKRENGKVVEIVSRARETFVGKLIPDENAGAPHGQVLMIADSKKMYTPFIVRGENLPNGACTVAIRWYVIMTLMVPFKAFNTSLFRFPFSNGDSPMR